VEFVVEVDVVLRSAVLMWKICTSSKLSLYEISSSRLARSPSLSVRLTLTGEFTSLEEPTKVVDFAAAAVLSADKPE
jgi:hypothetical protein